MTRRTDRYDMKPMLGSVTEIVMVFTRRLATGTLKAISGWKLTCTNGVIEHPASLAFFGPANFAFEKVSALCRLAAFIPVVFLEIFNSFGLLVASPLSVFDMWQSGIRKNAFLTGVVKSILMTLVFVEFRSGFNELAFDARLAYNRVRHLCFSIKQSCLEPVASTHLRSACSILPAPNPLSRTFLWLPQKQIS